MEENRERCCVAQEMFLQRAQPFEVTSEFVLPDYRSEISRLLWVRPVFSAPMHYLGAGRAELSGAVRYEVLYTGADGGLYGVELEDSYALSLPVELPAGFLESGGVELSATVAADTVISRVTAPRRLSMRCRMHADVRGYAEKDLSPRIEGAHPEGEERLSTALDCGRYLGSALSQLELTGELCPETEAELRVIGSRGEVFLTEASAAQGAVHCRGEAEITLLLVAEEEGAVPFTLSLSLPLAEDVPLEGASSDHRACATGTVGSITATVEEGRIAVAAGITLCVEAQGSEPVVLYRDLFVPGSRAECRFGEETLLRAGLCANRNFSVSEERTCEALSLPEDAQVLDAFATAELREHSPEARGAALSGELCCHILYRSGGEWGVSELRVPLRTTLEEDTAELLVAASVPRCRVRTEGGRVLLNVEVALALRGTAGEAVQTLAEVHLTPGETVARGDLELYYPCGGESLFDVGKRYGIAPARIAEANGLPADRVGETEVLSGTRYLLIPT